MVVNEEYKLNKEWLDLCDSCLEKITLVHSVGVQCERYKLERGGINE